MQRARSLAGEFSQQVEAADHRHDDVRDHNIGRCLLDEVERFEAIGPLADDAEVRLRLEQPRMPRRTSGWSSTMRMLVVFIL